MKNKSTSIVNNRIKKLDNRLANQIAAGEVVDRPASVLKELMENCIDAGAKRIDVEIERGGTRLIKVTDDGFGINKDDLTLALTRHATSKIKKVEDLSAIYSLGFRGEALASISSVSKLTLTSRTHDDEYAWQAISEGRDMAVDIQPASSVAGTRIEVCDLFFNTPARQKFLRTERTEFLQIEDVFKRMALANFGISFILKHNSKIIKRVPAVKLLRGDSGVIKKYLLSEQERSRLAIICGKTFSDLAIVVQCEHETSSIKAFVGGANCHRSEADIQYVFINNRAVKDKTLTHAIRQAYQDRLPPGRMATYVIFLTIDANKIDVNVHPTKHEVRFENQREVHDLLFRSISEALDSSSEIINEKNYGSLDFQNENKKNHNNNRNHTKYTGNVTPSYSHYSKERIYQQSERIADNQYQVLDKSVDYPVNTFASLDNDEMSAGKIYTVKNQTENHQTENINPINDVSSELATEITRLGNGFSIIQSSASVWVINEMPWFKKCFIKNDENNIKTPSIALMFPQIILVESSKLEEVEINQSLTKLGFDYIPINEKKIQLNGVPVWSKNIKKENIILFFNRCIESFSSQIKSDFPGGRLLTEGWMINLDSIRYFLKLNIFDFETEVTESEPCVKKIDAEFAEGLFIQVADSVNKVVS